MHTFLFVVRVEETPWRLNFQTLYMKCDDKKTYIDNYDNDDKNIFTKTYHHEIKPLCSIIVEWKKAYFIILTLKKLFSIKNAQKSRVISNALEPLIYFYINNTFLAKYSDSDEA